jgi:hypothetical protein
MGFAQRAEHPLYLDRSVAMAALVPGGAPSRSSHHQGAFPMHLTVAHIAPLTALIAGILILIIPRLLNYIVAIYLILVGLVGLNGIYHFMR